jgi:hypothetical protein
MDDPESLMNVDSDFREAKQIITCPVFAKSDKDDPIVGRAASAQSGNGERADKRTAVLGNFPRAIIQLINK